MAEGVVARARGLARKHEEKLRFLVVGVWNTVFATGLLWVLEHLLRPEGVVQKQLVLTLVWVIAVTQNFFTFKLLVFRTKGHWLREYARMYVTYSATFVVQSLLIQVISGYFGVSLFIANIPVLFIVTIMSYVGHKYFTFRHAVEAVDAGDTFDEPAEEPVPED
jgi:putative flippase GtrA